jgi:hypothetical protein
MPTDDVQAAADSSAVEDARDGAYTIIDSMIGSVDDLVEEVVLLREAVDLRPTAQDVSHRRRLSVAAMLLYGLLIIFGHDQHVEYCGPGARSERLLSEFAQIQEFTPEEIAALQRSYDVSPAWCDVAFPLHSHDVQGGFPGRWSILGGGIYAVLIGGVFFWARGPRSGKHRR